MHCLRCGMEIESPHVFCDRCLAEMEAYPVSRETPVILPKRPPADLERRGKKLPKPQKAEEMLLILRKRQRVLVRICLALTCITLLLAALLIFLPQHLTPKPNIGQNYVTNLTQPNE